MDRLSEPGWNTFRLDPLSILDDVGILGKHQSRQSIYCVGSYYILPHNGNRCLLALRNEEKEIKTFKVLCLQASL